MKWFTYSLIIVGAILILLFINELIMYISEHRVQKAEELRKKKLTAKVREKIEKKLAKRFGIMRRSLENMDARSRKISPLYLYYTTMNTVIMSMGLRNVTNVESLFLFLVVVSIIIGIVVTFGLALKVTLMVIGVSLIVLHSVLFFIARSETMERAFALMDAEDMISSNMEDGVVEAVGKSLSSIDVRVRYLFEQFYNDVTGLGEQIDKALLRLNISIGPMYDSFCENALVYYKDNDPVVLQSFKEQMKRNTKRRIEMKKQQVAYKNNLILFFACVAITSLLVFTSVSLLGVGIEYLFSKVGRVTLIIGTCSQLLGFAASQIVYSGSVT